LPETYTVEDIEALKILADTRRMSILESLDTPKTVKEMAEGMDVEPTKLYYHVNLLEKHRLIQIVDTKIVSGIIEKTYQRMGKRYEVDKHILATDAPSDQHIEDSLEIIFDSTKNDVRRGIKAGVIRMTDEEEPKEALIWRMVAQLHPEQYAKFRQRMHDVLSDMQAQTTHQKSMVEGEGPQNARHFGVTVALYPIVTDLSGDEQEAE